MSQPAIDNSAPISRRAIAYLIDALIAGGIVIVGFVVLTVVAFSVRPVEQLLIVMPIGYGVLLLVLLGWLVLYTVMQTGGGSIGMRAQGVRLASAVDGTPVGFGRALLRNVVFGLSASVVVGYFTPLFDGSGRFQGWHDRAANALMLDARTGRSGAAVSAAPATTAIGVVPSAPQPAGAETAPSIPGLPAPSLATPTLADFSAPPANLTAPAASVSPAPTPTASAEPQPLAVSGPSPQAPAADDGALIAFVPGVSRPAQPAPAAEAPITPPTAPPPGLDPALNETLVQRPGTASAPAQTVAATPRPPLSVPPVPPMPVASPSAPAAVAPAVHETSEEEAELEQTRISIPGHRLIFTWDDGTRVPVSRRTIFGRNPAPEDGAVLAPVRDETLSLSKTHFEAASESSGGWVLDRHSTNGMTIVRDGQRIACPPGQRVPVRLGDAIEIGDRIVTVGGYA